MRALSLNLIKGLIDEIEHKVYISWVQPRVLDINQVNTLFVFVNYKPFNLTFWILDKNNARKTRFLVQ